MARKPEIQLRGAEDLRRRLNANQKREIRQFYLDVYNDNKAEIDRLKHLPQNTSTRLQTMRLNQLGSQLKAAYNNLYSEVENKIVGDMRAVANAVIDDMGAFWKSVGVSVGAEYANLSTAVVEDLYFGRVYAGDWTLSKAIWGDYKGVSDDISKIIARGVAEGQGTYEIAKALEKYVNPNAQKPISWSRFYPGSKKQVDYNAVRLARTEISHAYQLAAIRTAAANPFAKGIKWHASVHANTCAFCKDIDGKVFPIDECPLDHPNGFCTFTVVLEKSLDEIADELKKWAHGGDNERLDRFFEKGSTIDPAKSIGISVKTAAAAVNAKRIMTVNGVNAVKAKPVSTAASIAAGHSVEVTAPGGDNGGKGEIYRDLGLTNEGKGGIIGIGSEKMLKVNTGGRRNEYNLTEEQLKEAIDYAVSLGMPRNRIYYVDYDCTGYGTAFDLLRIGTDVYPCKEKQKNANSNISMRGAIAHEIIGHRAAALAGKTHSNDVLEEVQASIRAARFTPNLSNSERIMLYRDAIARLRNNGIKLKDVKNDLYIWKE